MITLEIVPLFNSRFVLCISSDPIAEYERHKIEPPYTADEHKLLYGYVGEIQAKAKSKRFSPRNPKWLVYLRPGSNVDTISHEALHLAEFVTRYHLGEEKESSEETRAYLIGGLAHLFEERVKQERKYAKSGSRAKASRTKKKNKAASRNKAKRKKPTRTRVSR